MPPTGILLHLVAKNTPSGNPNRIFVAVDLWGQTRGVWDEGYSGIEAVPEEVRIEYTLYAPRIETTAMDIKFYKRLKFLTSATEN